MFKPVGIFTALACVSLALGASAQSVAPPKPSAEALAAARRVAAHDDFLALIQMDAASKIQDIEHGVGDLTPAEKSKVEAIGKAKTAEGADRVIGVMTLVYANTFTVDQLNGMAAFLESPAGAAYAGRLMTTLPAVGEGMKGFDFKREVLKETCAQIKKGCPTSP